ncbi:MAG: hypothetical protein EXR70_23505 [Deltaproteobacteria bacterium]|nr:hypothetical protein [Deltaproteobacteria bacterium]
MRKNKWAATLAIVTAINFAPSYLRAEDVIEKAGMAVELTAGNLIFLPLKVFSMAVGAAGGALSFVASGGNVELTKQIWRDTSEGPYIITPELARKSIGERPLLAETK